MPLIPKLDWRERERIARENDKRLICPICGKKCRKFLAPNGPCMPMHGFISSGQWYCGEEHAKQDPNSGYHKRLQQMNMI